MVITITKQLALFKAATHKMHKVLRSVLLLQQKIMLQELNKGALLTAC